jgi:hypothetical protein
MKSNITLLIMEGLLIMAALVPLGASAATKSGLNTETFGNTEAGFQGNYSISVQNGNNTSDISINASLDFRVRG